MALLASAAAFLTCSPSQAASRDPLRPLQWGLDQVHADQAWRTSTGKGVIVAVIDSGVDTGHPDLQGQLVKGKDFNGTSSVQDDCGHGTEVTGIIVARRGNGRGISGVAPEAKVMPLREASGCADDLQQMMAAVRYAADHGARVVNISSATVPVAGDAAFAAQFAADYQAAVDYAWSKNTLVVAGAGNSSMPTCAYPAALHHVLCVGAVGQDGTKAYYSHNEVRSSVDYLVAPGGGDLPLQEEIWTTTAGGLDAGTTVGGGSPAPAGYESLSGTSFATPFVSGVAALLFGRGWSVQKVHDRLLHTATDLGLPGQDPVYGWGEVDAAAALRG